MGVAVAVVCCLRLLCIIAYKGQLAMHAHMIQAMSSIVSTPIPMVTPITIAAADVLSESESFVAVGRPTAIKQQSQIYRVSAQKL